MPASSGPAGEDRGGRLDSWKEIAAYLGRQVRTVQGWEKAEDLPVHRLPHKKQGTVFAYKQELDAWQARHAHPEPTAGPEPPPDAPPIGQRHRARFWTALAGAAILAGIGGWAGYRLRAAPTPKSAPPVLRRYFAAATAAGGSVRLLPSAPDMHLVALSPDDQTLFAVGIGGDLERIQTASGTVAARLELPDHVSGIAMATDGRYLYVSHQGPWLTILDTETNSIRNLATEAPAPGLALSPDNRTLYLAMPYRGIERLDTHTLQEDHLGVPPCPEYLAIPANARRLFVSFQCGTNGGHDSIGVLDPASGTVLSRLSGPPMVGSEIALSPDGGELWADSGDACTAPQYDHRGCPAVPAQLLHIFSTGTGVLLKTVAAPLSPRLPSFGAIQFLPGGVQAVDGGYILDTARFNRLEALPASYQPLDNAVASRDGAHLYLPVFHDNRAAIADFTAAPAACSPPIQGLQAWWPGDGTADDAWGVENGQASASAGYAPGVVGQAFDLSQPGAFLSLGRHPFLKRRLFDLTLSGWFKFANAGPAPILNEMSFDGTHPIGWWLGKDATGRLLFCVGSGGAALCPPDRAFTLRGATRIAPGAWRHVAVAADGSGEVTLYLDGRQEARAQLDVRFSQAPKAKLLLGSDPSRHSFLAGWADEITLYDRALTPTELQPLVRMPSCLAENKEP